ELLKRSFAWSAASSDNNASRDVSGSFGKNYFWRAAKRCLQSSPRLPILLIPVGVPPHVVGPITSHKGHLMRIRNWRRKSASRKRRFKSLRASRRTAIETFEPRYVFSTGYVEYLGEYTGNLRDKLPCNCPPIYSTMSDSATANSGWFQANEALAPHPVLMFKITSQAFDIAGEIAEVQLNIGTSTGGSIYLKNLPHADAGTERS